MERITLYSLLAFLLFSLGPSICCSAKIIRNITSDQASLQAIKSDISLDPNHILESNWSSSSPVCNWIGVTCGPRHHRVTALDISSMNLTGTLSTHLGNLSFLVYLDLSGNKFHGNLPQELQNLRRLQVIQLGYNNFSGEIPQWLGSLSELRQLFLTNNSFTGFIPSSISNLSNLETLVLASNSFHGKIPEEIANLRNMKTLVLAMNQLTGSIPSKLFSIPSLEYIDFPNNKLSGDLPIDMCHSLPRLEVLSLSWNELSGQIPTTISNCSQLRVLSLSVNKFSGIIPKEIGKLVNLEMLYLGSNGFSKGLIPEEMGNLRNLNTFGMEKTQRIGSIPLSIFNLSALQHLNLRDNDLEGDIPEAISNLHKLEVISLYNNSLTGRIPKAIFNMSNLRILLLSENQLSGILPSNMGYYALQNLETLNLGDNNLQGVIPDIFSNSSRLESLQLNNNEFTGDIPDSLGDLRLLSFLTLYGNKLTSQGLKFITSLTSCRYLRVLDVSRNHLNGTLPASIGNLSALEMFNAFDCNIKGRIPSEIGEISNLIYLDLSDNLLTGSVPTTMKAIQNLDLANNSLEGSTLSNICELPNLYYLDFGNTNISGAIPDCLGELSSLRHISLYQNRLTSIPLSFWNLRYLINLELSSNFFDGSLPPQIGNLKVATSVNLSMNLLSGEIPDVISSLKSLEYLRLDHNRLSGSVPKSLGTIISLEVLDLSHNNLSGSIPKSLETLKYLRHFNVSFNSLRGEIPSRGPFENFTRESFLSNEELCGDSRFQVPPCPVISSTHRGGSKKKLLFILIGIVITVTILVMIFIFLLRKYTRKDKVSNASEPFPIPKPERISYYELLEATDMYSDSNLLGSGSFGSVYKGILKNEAIVAVKVFNMQMEGAFKSFDTECEMLRNLRHRNLIKVISSCCTEDFKALVLQYMSNGSLEKWMYSHNYFLNFTQRLNITIDIACAIEYLHHGYSTPLVHCDLKPSNILLDENFVAHVSDFGIAKLLSEEESISHTITLATMGYIAPEYGLEGIVSTRCDVYSFGILMMEIFTRTKPSNEMFVGDLSLKRWIHNFTPHEIIQVVDANLLSTDEQHFDKKLECLSSLMELALACSVESPNERINMKDVVTALKKIKVRYLAN